MKLYNELPENYEPYRTPIKLMPTETICCPASLKVDLYQGCSFSCLYCFAMDWFLHMYHSWYRPSKPADFSVVEKEFELAFKKNSQKPLSVALRHRQYVRLGSMTDSFQHVELEHKLTKKFFELCNSYDGYPVLIFTKSVLQSRDEYIKLMKEGNYVCQESISIWDDTLRKKIEPGTYSTEKRFEALEKLNKHNIPIQVRISPHLYPITTIEDTEKIIKRAKEVGCNEVIWEPIRITSSENNVIKQETGIDMISEMKKLDIVETDYGVGCYRNIYPYRQKVMQQVKDLVEDNGMMFYHCLAEDPNNATCPGEDCCGMNNYSAFDDGRVQRQMQQLAFLIYEKGELSKDEVTDLWTCDEKEFNKQWDNGLLAKYLANVIFDGKKYIHCKDAYLGERLKHKKIVKVDEWL